MTNDEHGYNGWTNYETWCVNLWLSNDEGTYNEVTQLVHNLATNHDGERELVCVVADEIQSFTEDLPECAAVQEQASFVADLFGAALSAVNWHEIAESWLSAK